VDYHFVTRDEFQRLVDSGEMLEHAMVYGQEKGVPKHAVRKLLDNGQDAIMRTDNQGARYIKSIAPAAVTIFIAPPSDEELEKRLRSRGGDSEEQVVLRLETARKEIAEADQFDYVVVNHDVTEAAAEIERIIAEERDNPGRQAIEFA
jgi:guanylate kinase